jgi:hypothetical protein
MNRLFRAAMVAAILPIGLASVGCAHNSSSTCGTGGCGAGARDGGGLGACYRNWVDVNWPDRYNYAARQSVVAPFAQQAATGHFLNQTLWNFYFEPTSDKLTPGGMDKLNALAHATPGPDSRIYLQHAHDIAVTQENMDKVGAQRNDLDARRAAMVRRYMASSFGPPMDYEILVHDAPTPVVYAGFVANAFRGQIQGYRGGISTGSVNVTSIGGSMSGPAPGSGSTTINAAGGGGAAGGSATGGGGAGGPGSP